MLIYSPHGTVKTKISKPFLTVINKKKDEDFSWNIHQYSALYIFSIL